jgi:hypothetical protein
MADEDKDMSNLRQRNTLLEENIKLKMEKEEANDKIDKLIHVISDKMDKMVSALEELKNKEAIIIQGDGTKTVEKDGKVKKEDKTKPFIPTADTSGMKLNVSPIEKKKRDSNLTGAADALSKLQKDQ